MTAEQAYHELCLYTLTHSDPAFLHQHAVDAYAAQQADQRTKPITLTFALVGLYLTVERGFTGRQVQQAHMALARGKKQWPAFPLPKDRGPITAADVVGAPPGPERDKVIKEWVKAVWQAYGHFRPQVETLLLQHRIIHE